MAAKADPTKQGWEESEFPILCETCLGNNPYVRMTKQVYGKECKSSAGCPAVECVQVRDTALGITNDAPRSEINREYFAQNVEGRITNGDSLISYHKADSAGKELLKRLARTEPYYKRNRPHICSFFVKGTCKRGDECPYRHEAPEENELSHQNIKDRYYGTNDPVAKKILNRFKGGSSNNSIEPPEDKTITSLFITGVEEDITEADLRGHFYAFGEIKSVVVVHRSHCAFINYATRAAAELAIDRSVNNLILKGHPLRIAWGRPRPTGPRAEIQAVMQTTEPLVLPPLESLEIPAPPGAESGTDNNIVYPSQDPTYQGSVSKG
ncbi:3794_t:CDS:10 [Paraglomus occultum]|uniref:Pre-mRNA-splicing factor SLT11 n=1 Tax=Paraglomus occultum TaxID=144539 RepID=A0A9N9FD96_9GLOM|nr:3794_t:CDS:10 [Paraglomus occultum]